MAHRIALMPGDGIGPEVIAAARAVLKAVSERFGLEFEFRELLVGGAAYEKQGVPLPEETLKVCRECRAGLLGAVGGPRWESLERDLRPERALLGLRRELDLFGNLRPAKMFDALVDASTLRPEVVRGLDILVVREGTRGIYFGEPRGIEDCGEGERGFNTMTYTRGEIERIVRMAFELARRRRGRVTSVDKSNVLEVMELWRRVATEVARDFPEVEFGHMYVDNCAMQLVRNPKQFDVIVTGNVFGDILSDEAAMLTGSIGMLASANKSAGPFGIYEPVHGSAPDIAGRDGANPLAAILSAAMMLQYSLDEVEAAGAIERAVGRVLERGYRTGDIHTPGKELVGTKTMGHLVAEEVLRDGR